MVVIRKQIATNAGEDVDKRKHLYTVESHRLTEIKVERPYDPAVSVMGFYLNNNKNNISEIFANHVYCCTVQNKDRPKYLPAEEWI